jgi:hypothetical protein
MTQTTSLLEDTGLEVEDITGESTFAARRARVHEVSMHLEGIRSVTRAFVAHPETMLQELVNSAVELCGADSAAISIEKENRTDSEFYHWIATAGEYSPFLNATLPRYPSACTICLERDRPQLFRVHQRFFDVIASMRLWSATEFCFPGAPRISAEPSSSWRMVVTRPSISKTTA